MKKTTIPATAAAAALFLLIGGAAVYGSVQLGVGTLTVPEPGFFPLLAALLLATLSAVLLVQEIRHGVAEAVDFAAMRPALSAIAVLGIYVFALGWLGYLGATALLVVALLAVFGVRRVIPYVLAVPLIAGGSYVLFHTLLKLQLPTGSLGL